MMMCKPVGRIRITIFFFPGLFDDARFLGHGPLSSFL